MSATIRSKDLACEGKTNNVLLTFCNFFKKKTKQLRKKFSAAFEKIKCRQMFLYNRENFTRTHILTFEKKRGGLQYPV